MQPFPLRLLNPTWNGCTDGTAIGYIQQSCNAPPPTAAEGPPPSPPALPCHRVQRSVIDRCTDDCAVCDLPTVATVLGGCTLEDGTAARDSLCTHIEYTRPTFAAGYCTELQLAVVAHCENDCETCDGASSATVLQDCMSGDGVAQVKGETFCVAGGSG